MALTTNEERPSRLKGVANLGALGGAGYLAINRSRSGRTAAEVARGAATGGNALVREALAGRAAPEAVVNTSRRAAGTNSVRYPLNPGGRRAAARKVGDLAKLPGQRAINTRAANALGHNGKVQKILSAAKGAPARAAGARTGFLSNPLTAAAGIGATIGDGIGRLAHQAGFQGIQRGGEFDPNDQFSVLGTIGAALNVVSPFSQDMGARQEFEGGAPADTNGDGYTSEAEFEAYMASRHGLAPGQSGASQQALSQAEASGQGMDLREFLTAEGFGDDPYGAIEQDLTAELGRVDAQYQMDLMGLREAFQLAETPEEKLALARQVTALEGQRDAAVEVIGNAYDQASGLLDASSDERTAEFEARREAVMGAGQAAETTRATALDGLFDGSAGASLAPALEAGTGASVLASDNARELALTDALGTVAADSARFLTDGLLGPEQAAQQGDLQRYALGQIANAQTTHAQQVADRINTDRRLLAQSEMQLGSNLNGDRARLLGMQSDVAGAMSPMEEALFAEALDRYEAQGGAAGGGGPVSDARRQAFTHDLTGAGFDLAAHTAGIDPKQAELLADQTASRKQYAASLSMVLQNPNFNPSDPAAWQAVMEELSAGDPAGFNAFMTTQFGGTNPTALANLYSGL